MNGTVKKILAVVLSVILMTSTVTVANAASFGDAIVDFLGFYELLERFFDSVLDIFGGFNMKEEIPEIDGYTTDPEYFYQGTGGDVTGDGWSLGYSSKSVIPTVWRTNAAGEADANGYCLKGSHYFGGYFTAKVNKIYDDQTVGVTVLSTGSDENGNGIDDIFVFIVLDGVGFTNACVRQVREECEKVLRRYGVKTEDIIGLNMNVTHAHTTIDPEGMSLNLVWPMLENKLMSTEEMSVEPELLASIVTNTGLALREAYRGMEDGTLSYYETASVGEDDGVLKLVNDKRRYGAAYQDTIACFLFESSESESKTILANLGMHPTKVGRDSEKISSDVPYYIGVAMREAGYNFMFIQGAQAAIGLSALYDDAGLNWAESRALTYDDWVARYGEEYATENYAKDDGMGESEFTDVMACGYTIAHFILNYIGDAQPVAPVINAYMQEVKIPFDYSLQYLGGVTGLLGSHTVEDSTTKSGYSMMVEAGYVELGNDIAIVLVPGEISPAIVFGTRETYTGDTLWYGPTSLTGEDWPYDSIENLIRDYSGDDDKTVLCFGLCNDAIGYIMPDCDTVSLAASVVDGDNENMISASTRAGSSFMDGYIDLLNKVNF